jgi:hypothetical protein
LYFNCTYAKEQKLDGDAIQKLVKDKDKEISNAIVEMLKNTHMNLGTDTGAVLSSDKYKFDGESKIWVKRNK